MLGFIHSAGSCCLALLTRVGTASPGVSMVPPQALPSPVIVVSLISFNIVCISQSQIPSVTHFCFHGVAWVWPS